MAALASAAIAEPNPPVFSDSVLIFGPEDPVEQIKASIEKATAPLLIRHTGHFSPLRIAIMFKPGTYPIDVHVG